MKVVIEGDGTRVVTVGIPGIQGAESPALTEHRESVGDHGDVDLTGAATGLALAFDGDGILVPTDMGTQIELTAETDARTAADEALQDNIDAEATARATADTNEANARAAADALLIPLTQKGAANGVATLGADGKLPSAQVPSLALSEFLGAVANEAAMLALTGQRGDWTVRTDFDPDRVFILETDDPTQVANWTDVTTPGSVSSVNGQAGVVVLDAGDVGADVAGSAATVQADVDAHEARSDNPHGVTKAQVGLSNVTNDAQETPAGAQAKVDAKKTFVDTDASDGDKVYTAEWHADATPNSGLRGFDLNRSAVGKPVGFTFSTGGTPEWDFGMDATTDDLVLVYDHEVPGDQLRYRKGGHLLFGHSVAQPANTYRFKIEATDLDPPTMTELLRLHGDTAHSGGNMTHILRVTNGTETVLSARADGLVGVGVLNPTTRLHVAQAQNGQTQFLLTNGTAGASSRVGQRIQSDAHSVFLEMFSSTYGTASLADRAMLYTNNTALLLGTNSTERMQIDALGNKFFGTAALATTATDGFVHIPSSAGPPTGTPTLKTGLVPLHVDTTNGRLYAYFGGAWNYIGF